MTPKLRNIKPLIEGYLSVNGNGAGGNLHLVLSDGNFSASAIRVCMQSAKEDGDSAGVTLCEILLGMRYSQREKIFLFAKSLPCPTAAKWSTNQ